MPDNRASKSKGPQFIRFLKPIIEVLRELSGSGTSSEVSDKVIEQMNIPDEEQSVILKSGQSRVYNQAHWARMYLVYGGIVDSSKRGVWTLTEKGKQEKGVKYRFLPSSHSTKTVLVPPKRYLTPFSSDSYFSGVPPGLA